MEIRTVVKRGDIQRWCITLGGTAALVCLLSRRQLCLPYLTLFSSWVRLKSLCFFYLPSVGALCFTLYSLNWNESGRRQHAPTDTGACRAAATGFGQSPCKARQIVSERESLRSIPAPFMFLQFYCSMSGGNAEIHKCSVQDCLSVLFIVAKMYWLTHMLKMLLLEMYFIFFCVFHFTEIG